MSATQVSTENKFLRVLKHIWVEYSIIVVTVVIFLVAGMLAPRFIQFSNIMLILRQASIIGIIALGMTYVIITGGIDLSSGHVVATAGAVLILLQGNPYVPLVVAILAGCVVGTVIGFVNGAIVTKFRVPAFIVTLAVGIMARSIALYLVEGRALTGNSNDTVFRAIGTGSIGFLPIPLLIWIFLTVLLGCMLKYTKFGTYVYAVGGNEISSKYSGIAVDKTKIIAYSLTGLCAGMAAVLDISRTVTLAVPTAGHMYEFDAITAVVVGGAALSGGRGKILNTFFGAIIITVVSNLMAMLGISVFLSGFVKGMVILVAVLLQRRDSTA